MTAAEARAIAAWAHLEKRNAGKFISSVAGTHPNLAFDFALSNRERVEGLVDASSRSRYLASLGTGSSGAAGLSVVRAVSR